jgi:hypothetical protein
MNTSTQPIAADTAKPVRRLSPKTNPIGPGTCNLSVNVRKEVSRDGLRSRSRARSAGGARVKTLAHIGSIAWDGVLVALVCLGLCVVWALGGKRLQHDLEEANAEANE